MDFNKWQWSRGRNLMIWILELHYSFCLDPLLYSSDLISSIEETCYIEIKKD